MGFMNAILHKNVAANYKKEWNALANITKKDMRIIAKAVLTIVVRDAIGD